ncbi:MAG: hypothetical protein ACOC44_04610 [Promethearchaeia archaeon]
MNIEALKFFHQYIREMINLGGPNFPKTISTQLGSKLARVYARKGIKDMIEGLKKSYSEIEGIPFIEKIDKHTYKVRTKYPGGFCPIGGSSDPENAKLIQESICIPFSQGFLSEFDPRYKYEHIVHECILDSENKEYCYYTLKLEERKNIKNEE